MNNYDLLLQSAFNLESIIGEFTDSLFFRFEDLFLPFYLNESIDNEHNYEIENALFGDPDYLNCREQNRG
jgi:hypothetical protein